MATAMEVRMDGGIMALLVGVAVVCISSKPRSGIPKVVYDLPRLGSLILNSKRSGNSTKKYC